MKPVVWGTVKSPALSCENRIGNDRSDIGRWRVDICDVLMPSPSPILCDCVKVCLRTIEFQTETLVLLSSGSFAANPDGFTLMKLYISVSSTWTCQVELPFAAAPLLSNNLPKEHWAMLGSKGHLVVILWIGVFTQAVLREPGNWVFFMLLAA